MPWSLMVMGTGEKKPYIPLRRNMAKEFGMRKVFSSESITEGHPDKVADRISDSILDAYVSSDPQSRVAAECCVYTNHVSLFGEVTSKAEIDADAIIRKAIRDIGYDKAEYGFSSDSVDIEVALRTQSPDIAMGLDHVDLDGGAGDQGILFGYAEKDGIEYMPLPISYAHRLTRKLTEVRKNGVIPYLRPDGKSQVSVEYDENGRATRITSVVLSSSHDDDVSIETLRKDLLEKVILPSLPEELIDEKTEFFINPTGRFVLCGPNADSGLTGRKLICDTYGGYSRHGGGAFSGKDSSKTDRTGAYAARFLAKNIVAAGLSDRCEVEIAYAIGVAKPVGLFIETFGTEHVPMEEIYEKVNKVDLRPNALIERFGLRSPILSHGIALAFSPKWP